MNLVWARESEMVAVLASSVAPGAPFRTEWHIWDVPARKEVQTIARDIDDFQGELEALDIQLKDRRIGLVDFPTELDGRRVLLCWRLGEPSVQYWHDEDAGYAGRQPLSPTLVG